MYTTLDENQGLPANFLEFSRLLVDLGWGQSKIKELGSLRGVLLYYIPDLVVKTSYGVAFPFIFAFYKYFLIEKVK